MSVTRLSIAVNEVRARALCSTCLEVREALTEETYFVQSASFHRGRVLGCVRVGVRSILTVTARWSEPCPWSVVHRVTNGVSELEINARSRVEKELWAEEKKVGVAGGRMRVRWWSERRERRSVASQLRVRHGKALPVHIG